MKFSTLIIAFFVTLCSFAQSSSLTIFNNNGQPFFVIMNGIRQNSIPQTNVKVGGMTIGSYEVKLIFADGKTGDINKTIYFSEQGDYLSRVIFKGSKRKLQYFGMTSATNPAPAGGTNIIYRPNDQATYSDQLQIAQPTTIISPTSGNYNQGTINGTTTNGSSSGTVVNNGSNNGTVTNSGTTNGTMNGTSTTVQTTTQTTTSGTATPNNGMGGVNINVNVSDPTMNGGNGSFGTTTIIKDPVTGEVINMGTSMNGTSTSTSTTTQTTTTTTSTTIVNGGTTTTQQGNVNQGNTVITQQPVYTQPTTTSYYNCTSVLPSSEAFVSKLKAASFDKDRVEMIQAEMALKCLNSQQAYSIINTLTFNTDRLEQAKFLFVRMTDKVNGGVLMELLTFDVDKKEYKQFMEENK